ncbi:hypothetical protein RM717_27080 [Streptomyces griseus]|uniref:Uncharacterized protein n=2 Tax=Streptomyces TaxID=1883 RepID=A0ABU2W8F7_9ACTN|nr:hypothetical protein [Streptomyces griseus]MDT0494175.1 hypothetical protein [Streptomyces griseus]
MTTPQIPEIRVLVAGGHDTGKTAFLHGMYQRLSEGVHDYFLYSEDRDEEIRLVNAWKVLRETGEFPRVNVRPQSYTFQCTRNFTPLLRMRWTDFRGGAAMGVAEGEEKKIVEQWRDELSSSDNVYLVMDGEALGEWVRNGMPENANFDSGDMNLTSYNRVVRTAMASRADRGAPPPSFVVLITKMDLLPGAADMPLKQALESVVHNLCTLVKSLSGPGVTALVCPVQIGDFKTSEASGGKVDPSLVHPKYLHHPICFSLWYHLTEELAKREEELAEIKKRISGGETELTALRTKSIVMFRNAKIQEVQTAQQARETERAEKQAEIAATKEQADLLMREFDRWPIIKAGKVVWRSGRSS